MQHLRQLFTAAALVCALTYSTFAGDMNCPVVQPTPTSGSSTTTTQASGTTAESAYATAAADSNDLLSEVVWSIGQGIMLVL